MFKIIKKVLYFAIYYSGIVYLLRCIYRIINNNPIKILYTHRIIDESDELFPFLKALDYFTVEEFEKKIKYLLKHYRIISLDECVEYLKNEKRPPNCVALTFDDGYRSIYKDAFPIFKKYNIPATVFLTVDFIENKEMIWHDKLIYSIGKAKIKEFKIPGLSNNIYKLSTLRDRVKTCHDINRYLKSIDDHKKDNVIDILMNILGITNNDIQSQCLTLSWDEIREMHNSGLINFESHTISHPLLTKVALPKAKNEIQESKRIIEEKLGKSVKYFAYPGGYWNKESVDIIRQSGYKGAFTTINEGNVNADEMFLLKRNGFIREPFYMFGLSIGGCFELLRRISVTQVMQGFGKLTITGDKGLRYWLPYYIWQKITPKENLNIAEPIHIMLCIVDHFEPFREGVDLQEAELRIKTWVERYPQMASKHKDADGKPPQHTWFYPPHHDHRFLKDLVGLCGKGFGEIEMHLHHNHMSPFPDTSETLRAKIIKCIEEYSKCGIFCLPDGSKSFAFVHGDWSLDNSKGEEFCGVNNEIKILKECGCYADFTFPSMGKAQPSKVNKFYYAIDDPDKPKSYNWGKEVIAGRNISGDLLMITGLIGLRWKSRTHKYRPSIESSNIGLHDEPFSERIDYWINNAITIKGRPNWKFIKLHTHGAPENAWDSLFGESAEKMHQYLGTKYNDGDRYVLHYVTAREMYNIIKAVEANELGTPGNYRNYKIPNYIYHNN